MHASCHDRPGRGSLESASTVTVDDEDNLAEVLAKLELDDQSKPNR